MRKLLLVATMLASPALAHAEGNLETPAPITQATEYPDMSSPQALSRALEFTNPANSPITGAGIRTGIIPLDRPPSLEALMAARPGLNPEAKLPEGRASILREAGKTYGAAGGLYARGYALTLMLQRHEAELDRSFDFRRVVIPLGDGSTMLLPPVVSEAQRGMALENGGQRARTTNRIYRITREAEIGSEPPNWRTYLVQTWPRPVPPTDAARPQNRAEVAFWEQNVAEGWALGETQAVDVFRAKLSALQSSMVGMFRYKELLAAGMVEKPTVKLNYRRVQGGGGVLRLGDTDIQISGQGRLQASPNRWRDVAPVPFGGPIGQPGR